MLQTTVTGQHHASSLIVPYQQDPQGRQVWAVFTQVNIPIFSEQNGIPFFRRLELEVSWRHDQYSDVKGTSNPKVAFNWAPIDDLTIRGTWGTSFRAPVFGELSPLANVAIAGQKRRLLGTGAARCRGLRTGGALPPEGSGAWKLMSSFGNGTPGSTTLATGPHHRAAQRICRRHPVDPGHPLLGGSAGAEIIRAGGLKGWRGFTPELATNWGIGFDYTPSEISSPA